MNRAYVNPATGAGPTEGKMNAIKVNVQKGCVERVITDIPVVNNHHDVVVKVAFAGICGTDIHIIERKFDCKDGTIMGHEISGIVHQVHPDNTAFKPGDHVVINPNSYCGACQHCRKGLFNLCMVGASKKAVGIMMNGGWAEYVKVDVASVFKLPNTVPLNIGILCEPLSCIIHGLDKAGPIKIGSRIVIVGAGIAGLLWALIMHYLGHRDVLLICRNQRRRELIDNLGMDFKCSEWGDICEDYDVDSGQGIDVLVDCAGSAEAIEEIMPSLAPSARVIIFAVPPPGSVLKLHPNDMFTKEYSIMGVVINTAETFQTSVEMIGKMLVLDYERLGIKTYQLGDYQKALKDLKNRVVTKAVFDLTNINLNQPLYDSKSRIVTKAEEKTSDEWKKPVMAKVGKAPSNFVATEAPVSPVASNFDATKAPVSSVASNFVATKAPVASNFVETKVPVSSNFVANKAPVSSNFVATKAPVSSTIADEKSQNQSESQDLSFDLIELAELMGDIFTEDEKRIISKFKNLIAYKTGDNYFGNLNNIGEDLVEQAYDDLKSKIQTRAEKKIFADFENLVLSKGEEKQLDDVRGHVAKVEEKTLDYYNNLVLKRASKRAKRMQRLMSRRVDLREKPL